MSAKLNIKQFITIAGKKTKHFTCNILTKAYLFAYVLV